MASMGSFKKPQANLYKSFLHLDGDAVINCLSGLEGGDVDEVLTKVASESGRELGGELDLRFARGKAGKRSGERFEEEIRRKRTEHSAAMTLLRKLHDADALGIVEGTYGPEIHCQLEERTTIEFKANIQVHPLHQVVTAARDLVRVGQAFGLSKTEVRSVSEVASLLEALS
jgi:hypothetical protein